MKNLDVMVILNSGIDKLSFAKKLLKIRQNTNDRLILVFPQKRVKHFNHDIYERLTNKDFFEMNWDEENWHESPFFMIKPPSYEEWLNEIQYRMTADPQIDNAVLLVDDYKYSGHTINTTENDLVKIGYQKEYIFSHAHTLDISDRDELCDTDGNELSINNLMELLK